MSRFRSLLSKSCPALLIAALIGGNAGAVELKDRVINKDEPALLVAEHVNYDDKGGIASATGNVEIVQDNNILRADSVVYDINNDKVTAIGHVSIMQPSGDVFFADHVVLTSKMQRGVVKDFQARLKGNSLFAARRGERVNESVTKLDKLVYSPCKVCKVEEGQTGKAPLWQIQARKAKIDDEAKRVTYNDAYLDVYGVPVIYTPYFSHPTPDAPSQSGVLTPQFFRATDLGSVVKLPVYLSLAPDMDMTLTPWYISDEHPLLAGEFRKLFERGELTVNGAITDTYNRDSDGAVIPGTQVRGYIKADGRYQLSDTWNAGLNAERTTDNTFLQRYRLGWRDVLTSRAYAERIEDRNYASVEALSFQGLTVQDDSSVSPTVLPKAKFHYESAPQFAGSRATLDGGLLVTQRSEGVSTRRFSGTAGWKIPYITRSGQVFEAGATLRGDVYDISDQTTNDPANPFSGTVGRVIPQATLNWRYPFVRKMGDNSSLMIAPVAEVAVSPRRNPTYRIPNEDSQVAELNDTNLFSANRYTGLDQVESGARFTYGMRGHLQTAEDEWMEWLLGQTYQEDDDSAFPITNDPDPHFSDYIGRLGLKYRWFDVSYSFRLDRDSLIPLSNNVNTVFTMHPVGIDVTYTALRNDPIFGNRKEIFGNAYWDITDNWQWSMNARRDLGSNDQALVRSAFLPQSNNPLDIEASTVGIGTALMFHNECLRVTASVGRSFISQADVRPSTTFGLLIVLNNFGAGEASSKPTLDGAGNLNEVESAQGNAMPLSQTSESTAGSTP